MLVPNYYGIQPCKPLRIVHVGYTYWLYNEKCGDYVNWGIFQEDSRLSRNGRQPLTDVYDNALNSGSIEEALKIIRRNDPRIFTLQYHNLRHNYERIFYKHLDPYRLFWAYSSFNITRLMNDWIQHNFLINAVARPEENIVILKEDCIKPISLIIEGPSYIGKTAWAHSLGNHNYICGHLNFNQATFHQDVLYNVIDDVSPVYLCIKHWRELIGAQRDWQTNRKYEKPIRIKDEYPNARVYGRMHEGMQLFYCQTNFPRLTICIALNVKI
ncbi:uncharacterized protein LOC120276149 [Dioscorea cayenensis subsp. rotundata]|uniref:Uncharacterized protein LOC120276149 n=1 Tax=Dioscorea cayennensis subsp. rotundata TaxID=55577 RepID=A0AB40CG45_DIOCR|nr:uncharacterized protein LOC120276149 [Dioscorea cayenensis subsp. rotundata]